MHPSAIVNDPSGFDVDVDAAEVIRIRLWNSRNGCALVSECQGADRVLASWAERCGAGPVVFEVVFDDGLVVQGAHEFFRKGRRKCLFATHVQRILRRAAGRPVPVPMRSPLPLPLPPSLPLSAVPAHGLARCFVCL